MWLEQTDRRVLPAATGRDALRKRGHHIWGPAADDDEEDDDGNALSRMERERNVRDGQDSRSNWNDLSLPQPRTF